MQFNEQKKDDGENEQKALLIGDAKAAFLDSVDFARQKICICETILDGITQATEKQFETVFVVMSSLGIRLQSLLGMLRRVSHGAKIILLVRMHEEPKARQLTELNGHLSTLADDYYICPIEIERLCLKAPAKETTGDEHISKGLAESNEESRIKKLEQLATRDDLTNLRNRRYVREFLRQIIVRAKSQELQVTLLVFDIDNFKQYNDSYGHSVGDNVLQEVSLMMNRCCRSHDVVGRIGGDEFAVIFWDCRSKGERRDSLAAVETDRRQKEGEHPREALFMAERFRHEISSAELCFLGSEGQGNLMISGGLASFPEDGKTSDELFERADAAMLEAKRKGKNQIFLVGRGE